MSSVLYPSTLWLGVPNLSRDQLKNFDPAYTGYVHIFVVRTPPVLEKYDSMYGTNHYKNFRAIFERTTTSFTGIPELVVNYADQVHGYADRRVPHATTAEFNFDTGTFRCLEFKDLPVWNMAHTWSQMVAGDEISKIKDYKGLAASMPGGYSLENHTASFIIVTTSPDMTQIMGRAHYITAASPTGINFEHFNWQAGEISIVDGYDISIRGVIRWGPEIDAKAMELVQNRLAVINYYTGYNSRGQQYMTPGGVLNGDTIAPQRTLL